MINNDTITSAKIADGMNKLVLQAALDFMVRAQKILQMEGNVIGEDLDDPIKQLSEQIKEMI